MQTPQAIHGQPCVNTQGSTQASLGMFVADWLSHLVIASRASQGPAGWGDGVPKQENPGKGGSKELSE